MPAKKKSLTAVEQSARFIEAAKKTGADESGKTFEEAFKKIIRPLSPNSRQKPAKP